jgi:hypothetical protein
MGVHCPEARDPFGDGPVVIERGAIRTARVQRTECRNPRANLVSGLAGVARDRGVGQAVERGQFTVFEQFQKRAIPFRIQRMQTAIACGEGACGCDRARLPRRPRFSGWIAAGDQTLRNFVGTGGSCEMPPDPITSTRWFSRASARPNASPSRRARRHEAMGAATELMNTGTTG